MQAKATYLVWALLALLEHAVHGAPPAVREEPTNGVKDVKRIQEMRGADGYNLQYVSDDGTVRVEKGGLVQGVWVVRGSVTSYKPGGKVHTLYYLADNYGFRTTETLTDGENTLSSDYDESKQPPEEKEEEDNELGFRLGAGALESLAG